MIETPQIVQSQAQSLRRGAIEVPEPSCDVVMLFATDGLTAVGCSGALCHQPDITSPDLMSDGLEQRLLDQPSNPKGRVLASSWWTEKTPPTASC